ncbi:MAG: deoxyribose-phosphate aldolase, partial [Armatimonadetes bacterium]|nr:deoxyribose-phosphate aldolase [Armatimonadota bacterium]
MNAVELAGRIEHAVLNPQATEEDLADGARLAARWKVRALVVKPCHVAAAARLLAGTGVKVVTVVGFPHGGQATAVKAEETADAVAR